MEDKQINKIELVHEPTGTEIDLTENRGYTANPMGEIQTVSMPPEDFWSPVQASTEQSSTGQSQPSED